MAAPPNTSLATATVLASLPATVTQDVHDAGTTYTVWYRVTVPLGVTVLGAFAFGDLAVYKPTLEAPYNAAGNLPPTGWVLAENKPVQFPVTPGTQVWLRIRPNAGHPSPASLTLTVEAAPCVAVAVGALFVPDDAPGYPAAILSPTTGAVLQFVSPFPAGEQGDALADGTVLVSDEFTDLNLKRYNATFTTVTAVAWAWLGTSPTIRTNHGSQQWYVGSPGAGATPARVSTVSAAGVLGPTTWVLPEAGLRAAAASYDDTELYFSGQASGGSALQRWDLLTDSAGSDLAATIVGYAVTDILVLSDDSIVVGYFKGSAPQDLFVRRYTAAGGVINTYLFGANHTSLTPRLSYAVDPGAFWVWTHPDTPAGFSVFHQIRAIDGVALTTLTVAEFEGGVAQPAASPTPPARFGMSFSCPFFPLRVALLACVPGGGGTPPPAYTLDERHIRRLRRAPHVNHEHKRVFFRSFELDLERGQGLATGQGSDPIITLCLSRDGGQTWGEPVPLHAGRLGAYTQRVIARRLGVARDTVFEVTVSDPVAWSLVGAWLDLEPGTS